MNGTMTRGSGSAATATNSEAELRPRGDIVNCESVPGKTGSLSMSSYSSHSMMAIHYVPLGPLDIVPQGGTQPASKSWANPLIYNDRRRG